MAASQWFRSVEGALRTIAGYEAMNMIRKGQIRWLAKGDTAGVRSVTSSRFSGSLLNTIFRSPSNSLVPNLFATDPENDIARIMTPFEGVRRGDRHVSPYQILIRFSQRYLYLCFI